MTTNPIRGGATLAIAGRSYDVALTIGAAAAIGQILGCSSLRDLPGKMLEAALDKIPEVVRALLEGNGHKLSPEAVSEVDLMAYPLLIQALYTRPAGDASGNAMAPVPTPEPATPSPPLVNGHSDS